MAPDSKPIVAPACVGIIMDGNRRWAKDHGLPTLEGHRRGLEKLKEITRAAFSAGVKTLYFYAFSTENWNRAPEEVSYLMNLFAGAIKNELAELKSEGVRVRFVGDLTRLSPELLNSARALEAETVHGQKGTLALCLSYGGRPEILAAVNTVLEAGKTQVSEEELRAALWGGDLPDPDLIVRTSGERRLSNFLTWQSAYSELAFTKTKWPDFTEAELLQIFSDYASRERRHGK